MKNEIVKIKASDYGLDETKAAELIKNLPQIITERDVFVSQFDEIIRLDINEPDTAKKARELRIRIRDNRTKGIEVWHKTTKDYFLKGGQFVDAIRRMESAVNERMETDLEKIERYQENLEHDRLEKLRVVRLELLKPYTDIEPLAVANMEQAVFDNLLQGFKLAYETRIAAEKKAEEEAIENKKKDEIYNKRTSFIAGKKSSWFNQFKTDLVVTFTKETTENDWNKIISDIEVEEKKLLDQAIKDAQIKKEQEEKEEKETEIKKRKSEEKKAKLAPDKDKLLSFMQSINDLPRPEVKSIEAASIAANANTLLVKVVNYIKENADKL